MYSDFKMREYAFLWPVTAGVLHVLCLLSPYDLKYMNSFPHMRHIDEIVSVWIFTEHVP